MVDDAGAHGHDKRNIARSALRRATPCGAAPITLSFRSGLAWYRQSYHLRTLWSVVTWTMVRSRVDYHTFAGSGGSPIQSISGRENVTIYTKRTWPPVCAVESWRDWPTPPVSASSKRKWVSCEGEALRQSAQTLSPPLGVSPSSGELAKLLRSLAGAQSTPARNK